jgi:hypothetical protein
MHQSARFQTIFSNNRPAESRVLAIFASQPILKNLTTGQGRRSEHAQAMGILEGPRILKVEGKSAVQYSRIRTGRAGSAAFDAMSMHSTGGYGARQTFPELLHGRLSGGLATVSVGVETGGKTSSVQSFAAQNMFCNTKLSCYHVLCQRKREPENSLSSYANGLVGNTAASKR